MKTEIKMLAGISVCLSSLIAYYPFTEVHWATKDTVFIWAEHCEIINTCEGYNQKLKSAMSDGSIKRWEYWELKEVFEQGEDKYRVGKL